MSVPHILADESSAYYHGYVLAELSVHQTRAYFLRKYGFITDNPEVGRELAEVYWKASAGGGSGGLVCWCGWGVGAQICAGAASERGAAAQPGGEGAKLRHTA